MAKRIMVSILAVAMVLSSLSTVAFASEYDLLIDGDGIIVIDELEPEEDEQEEETLEEAPEDTDDPEASNDDEEEYGLPVSDELDEELLEVDSADEADGEETDAQADSEGKIVDEETLLAALNEGLENGDEQIVLAIAVPEIELSAVISISQDADIVFTIDEDPIEEIDGNVILRSTSNRRHINLASSGIGSREITLTFEGITLDGGGTGGGIQSQKSNLEGVIRGVEIQNCYSASNPGAMYLSGSSANLTLEDIYVHDNSTRTGNGGGIAFTGNSMTATLNNVTVTNNTSTRAGGGIAFTAGNAVAVVTDSVISGNTASGGAGIYMGGSDSSLRVVNTSFTDNHTDSGNGAGVNFQGSGTLIIEDSIFTGNTTGGTGSGAAINSFNAANTISGTEIRGNSTNSSSTIADGGGIYISNSQSASNTTLITDTVIADNHAANGGGLATNGRPVITITDTEISGNSAVSKGGGIYANASYDLTLDGTTSVSGNTALNGGGIYKSDPYTPVAMLTLKDSVSLSDNVAEENGGAIWAFSLEGVEARDNVVFSGNQSAQGYHLTDADDAALHAQQIDETVSFHEDFDYAYNNHDIIYTDGEAAIPSPSFKIVDEATLLQAINEGIERGDEQIVLPIAVPEIQLTSTITLSSDVDLLFTVDEEPVEAIDGEVVLLSGGRHFTVGSVGRTISLSFEGVVLDGHASSGGIESERMNTNLTVTGAVIENVRHNTGSKAQAIRVSGNTSKLTVIDTVVRDSTTGGIYVSGDGSELTVIDSEITGMSNGSYSAVTIGGTGTSGSITGSRIANNARTGSSVIGAVSATVNTDTLTVTNSEVTDNTGGGIYSVGADIYVVDSLIARNTARSGAGIYTSGDVLEISGTTEITGNTVSTTTANGETSGAGVYANGSQVTIRDSVRITGNTGATRGGGVHLLNPNAQITDNVVISGNEAEVGGGVFARTTYNREYNVLIDGSVQITDNVATEDGGGIQAGIDGKELELVEVRGDVVFSGNTASQGYYLTDDDDAALHARQIDETVSFHEDFDYAYNNHDIGYTDGETEPPVSEFKIVDYETLLQAINEGLERGDEQIVLPIAVPELTLTRYLSLSQDANLLFTVDPDPVEEIDGDVVIYSTGSYRHLQIVTNTNLDVTLAFEGVILDGNGTGGGIDTSRNYTTLTLEGAVIQNCYKSSGTGSAINMTGTNDSLNLIDSVVKDNTGSGNGIIYVGNSNSNSTTTKVVVENSRITGNTVTSTGSYGGAFYVYGVRAQFDISNSEISGNTAYNAGGIYAGGNNSTLTITDSKINNNTARSGSGGGINVPVNSGQFTMTGTELIGNSAGSSGGGAIIRGPFTIEDCTVTDNTAGAGGAGLYLSPSAVSTVGGDTLIARNVGGTNTSSSSGTKAGGGIFANNGTITITDSVQIVDNKMGTDENESHGGGIGIIAADVIVSGDVVISGNQATYGGGIGSTSATRTIVIRDNAQITGNTAVEGGGVYLDDLANLEVRGNAVFSGNESAQGYYLTDPDDAVLHAQQIDETVIWTEGYDYIYNNHDVCYTKGSTEPPEDEVEVESIRINAGSMVIMRVGDTRTLEAVITPSNATDQSVTWSSANESIVVIDANTGELTVVGQGLCQVTATSANGKTHSIYISAS